MYKYPLISIEGVDRTGKSTQAKLLVDSLNRDYGADRFILTHYPGGTKLGGELRKILLGDKETSAMEISDEITRQLIFAADIRWATLSIVIPALKNGQGVVVDRFLSSNYIYSTSGCGIDKKEAIKLLELCIPQREFSSIQFCNILLDAPIPFLKERWSYDDLGDSFPLDYYERVREGYLKLVNLNSNLWHVINANDTIQTISQCIYNVVTNQIEKPSLVSNEDIFNAI